MKTIAQFEIPKTMRSLLLINFGKPMEVQETHVPVPGKSEILIKMDSSPINPSDNSFLKGNYGSRKKVPVIPGFEGSGLVVATANDWMSRRLLGKRVACFAPMDGNGTWAEYMVTKSNMAVPLKKNVDLEQGSMLMVNPLSVMAMVDISLKGKHKAIANTAAASALGQMLNRVCLEKGLPIVHIVRRHEQAELLKSQGAQHIVNSSSKNFTEQLQEKFEALKVTLAFDAIAGPSTYELIEALPSGGEVMIYGGLSEELCTIHPGKMIFEKKVVRGFWLSEWIAQQNIIKLLSTFNKIQKLLSSNHQANIQKRVSLADTEAGRAEYLSNMTAGKVLVKPNM